MVQPTTQLSPEINQTPVIGKKAGKSALSQMLEKNQESQYNIFMKMFLAQVKHQSPDNPMSTHEMTQSVMSFMQAAEHTQTNKLLKQGNDLKLKEQISTARGYLNKEIDYNGDVIGFEGTPQKIQFQIPTNLEKASLEIIDINTKAVVKTIDGSTRPGKQIFNWAGEMNGTDIKAQPGMYIVKVTGIDKAQQTIPIETVLQGRVREIAFDDEENEHFLIVNNNVAIHMRDVISERKVESSDFANLNQKLDAQIRQYEELNKLLRKKFDVEEPIPELISLPTVQEQITQNEILPVSPAAGENTLNEVKGIGNWVA